MFKKNIFTNKSEGLLTAYGLILFKQETKTEYNWNNLENLEKKCLYSVSHKKKKLTLFLEKQETTFNRFNNKNIPHN